MPLPSASFGVLKATLDPRSHGIPHNIGGFRSEIGQDQPGISIAFIPTCQQGTAERLSDKAVYMTTPSRSCLGNKSPKPHPFLISHWAHLRSEEHTSELHIHFSSPTGRT